MDLRRQNRKVSVGVGSIFIAPPHAVSSIYVHWTPHILASLGWGTNHFHLLCHLQWVGSVPPTGVLLISGWEHKLDQPCLRARCVWGLVALCTVVAISLVQDTDRNDNMWRILF